MTSTENLSNHQRILRSINEKASRRPEVDSQGHPISEPMTYTYDKQGRLIGTQPAEPESS